MFTAALLLASPMLAQYADLATTRDGSDLYFTSKLFLRDSAEVSREKPFVDGRVYRWSEAGGVTLFAERGERPGKVPYELTGLQYPHVSNDGRTVAMSVDDACVFAPCPSPVGLVRVDGETTTLGPGYLDLSANGRWALLTTTFSFDAPQRATLVDLANGARRDVPLGSAGLPYRGVASDGTLLTEARSENGARTRQFALWKEGQSTPIPQLGSWFPLCVSDNAKVLLIGLEYNAPWLENLGLYDLETRRTALIYQTPDSDHFAVVFGLSEDGTRVLYSLRARPGIVAGEVFRYDLRTGKSDRVDVGEPCTAGVLSGDGRVLFLVTASGRIQRVDWETGAVRQTIGHTPYVSYFHDMVTGSLAVLDGAFVASIDYQNKIRIGERSVPVLRTPTGGVAIQIPWEQSWGQATLRLVAVDDESPFEQIRPVSIDSFRFGIAPTTRASGVHGLEIYAEDGVTLLQRDPQPGETVHLMMTGLGAVETAELIETGVETPETPAFPTKLKPQCGFTASFNNPAPDAETLFSGLQSGRIGVYRLTMRLPKDASKPPYPALVCGFEGRDDGRVLFIVGY